jgi:hypothetical protein
MVGSYDRWPNIPLFLRRVVSILSPLFDPRHRPDMHRRMRLAGEPKSSAALPDDFLPRSCGIDRKHE